MKTKFVYEAQEEVQESLPYTKVRKSKKYSPKGSGHIFKVRSTGELEERSLCGLPKYEISSVKTLERESRLETLPVCKGCGDAWKLDADSEWAKWQNLVKDAA